MVDGLRVYVFFFVFFFDFFVQVKTLKKEWQQHSATALLHFCYNSLETK